MSYTQPYTSMMRFKSFMVPQGFGAVVSCPANTGRDPVDGTCYCNPGYEGDDPDNKPCTPIDVKQPCRWSTQFRSPIDKKCVCPPGMVMNPDPTNSVCVPLKWFPNCKDAAGNKVPGCFMGYNMRGAAMFAAGGVVLGAFLMLVIKS